ncbi:GNAT family N-acetyltransferase [Sphaerisporangium viridialbum]|uniref:GNAT family N-acetyltransferase n=1 Tax=Sphaerisporangium viridialbum TaxID=46189 RepID=UPI003C7181C1
MTDLEMKYHAGPAVEVLADELVDLFGVVWRIPPYAGNPRFSAAVFGKNLRAAMSIDGCGVLAGRIDGQLVGCAYGLTMPGDWPSWVTLGDARPQEVQEAADAGQVFWLRELMVLPDHARQGFGRQLHDAMLALREEPWTALHCIVDNEPAYSAYPRWGYQVIGRIEASEDAPAYDVMLLPPT